MVINQSENRYNSDQCVSEFHKRLQMVNGVDNQLSFSRKAGISQASFNRILKGGYPSLKSLIAIANAGNVTVEWLATGQEQITGSKVISSSTDIDMELLQACIQGTEEHLAAAGQIIDSGNKALIVANLYSLRVKERKAATEKSDLVEADGSNQSRVG